MGRAAHVGQPSMRDTNIESKRSRSLISPSRPLRGCPSNAFGFFACFVLPAPAMTLMLVRQDAACTRVGASNQADAWPARGVGLIGSGRRPTGKGGESAAHGGPGAAPTQGRPPARIQRDPSVHPRVLTAPIPQPRWPGLPRSLRRRSLPHRRLHRRLQDPSSARCRRRSC